MQERERLEKIGDQDNKWYGMVKRKEVPGYLEKGWGESRVRRIARFRLANEMREGSYWEGEEERCKLCGMESESRKHVWEMWRKGGAGWQEMCRSIFGEGETGKSG